MREEGGRKDVKGSGVVGSARGGEEGVIATVSQCVWANANCARRRRCRVEQTRRSRRAYTYKADRLLVGRSVARPWLCERVHGLARQQSHPLPARFCYTAACRCRSSWLLVGRVEDGVL